MTPFQQVMIPGQVAGVSHIRNSSCCSISLRVTEPDDIALNKVEKEPVRDAVDPGKLVTQPSAATSGVFP
jgi:hypothetical protein